MAWKVIAHPEFYEWLDLQDLRLQDELYGCVSLPEEFGPQLGRPRVDTIKGSKIPNLTELRLQFKGKPWRVLFAFDPKRNAILLLGGNKTGQPRWYKENIPIAEKRFREYLDSLRQKEK
jgi:hypothetical protein